MKALTVSVLSFFFFSCSAIKVDYDYDPQVDFDDYTTYNVYNDMDTGLSGLEEKRMLRALDAALKQKGILFSEEADLLVDIKRGLYRSQPNNTVGVGLGGTGRNLGGGINVGIPVGGAKLQQELQFNLVDAKRDQLIWEAKSSSPYDESESPAMKDQRWQQLLAKVFEKFPPKVENNP